MSIGKTIVSLLILLIGGVCQAQVMSVDSLMVVSGVVKEGVHKKKLAGATLSVTGSNIATVTNDDGFFSLKLPKKMTGAFIRIQHLGYVSGKVRIPAPDTRPAMLEIRLEPSPKMLDGITVYGAEPRSLIENAIRKIPSNYSASRNYFSSFYRETIRKGRRYIGVSEAIVDVSKNSYASRQISGDRVRLVKGRRLVSQRPSDTLAVKIAGGPMMPVVLDVVKNEDLLFSLPELDFYEFTMEAPATIDGRSQFVVSFRPKVKVDYALHKGKVFIDRETLSFSRAEFSLDVSDKAKATRAILYSKPRGLRFNLQEVEFLVSYKYQDGVSYLNYIRTKTRFKCDWKRRLFSSGYTACAEMVMVDRDDDPSRVIPRDEAFRRKDIFYDMIGDFSDSDFWRDYNIIEPAESLEKALLKLHE